MKRLSRTAALAAGLALLVPAVAGGIPAFAADKVSAIDPTLTPVNLLNINDFHGRIDGGNLDGALGKQVACTVVTAKATLGADKTAFLSAGDNVGATTFVSSSANDEPTLTFLNALGLQASAVGNHEFDRGFGDLESRIMPHSTFSYLGANVYNKGTMTPALPEYKVLTVNGVRVGVIGAVTQQTPQMVSPAGVSGLDFGDPVAAVNRVADKLTNDNLADIVVAEYHEGAANGSANSTLAAETASSTVFNSIVNGTNANVDVIFNGHTHALYAWDGSTTPGTRSVSQSASYGSTVGQLQLGYDPATKTVKQYKMTQLATSGANLANCAADPAYQAAASIVTTAVADAKTVGSKVIGKVSADITRAYKDAAWVDGVVTGVSSDDRLRESTLSNLEAEVWRQTMNVPGRAGADIGVQNPGGVRADLKYAESNGEGDGNVTFAEAASINPFANTLITEDITGAQLKTLLEQQWQPGKSRPFVNLGLSENVRWTFDETRAHSDKVTSIFVNDKMVKAGDTFRVVTNSFLGAGGDNFSVLAEAKNVTDAGLIDMDAFITYLTNAGTVSPDFTKLGVEVEGSLGTLKYGKKSGTLTVQGWDLTSLGSPRNLTATASFVGGEGSFKVSIVPDHVDGLPTLDGVAKVSFKMTGALLPASKTGTQYLTLVSDQTGTTVTIPVTVKR